jgi:hypothetical protein
MSAPNSSPSTNELIVPPVCQSHPPAHETDADGSDESNLDGMVAVGVGNDIALAVAATGMPVVIVAVCESEVMTGTEAVDVDSREADERLCCRARQAGCVAQTLAGESTGPVEAC